MPTFTAVVSARLVMPTSWPCCPLLLPCTCPPSPSFRWTHQMASTPTFVVSYRTRVFPQASMHSWTSYWVEIYHALQTCVVKLIEVAVTVAGVVYYTFWVNFIAQLWREKIIWPTLVWRSKGLSKYFGYASERLIDFWNFFQCVYPTLIYLFRLWIVHI